MVRVSPSDTKNIYEKINVTTLDSTWNLKTKRIITIPNINFLLLMCQIDNGNRDTFYIRLLRAGMVKWASLNEKSFVWERKLQELLVRIFSLL